MSRAKPPKKSAARPPAPGRAGVPAPAKLSPVDLAAAYDELPLWSAPFASLLLEQIDLRDGLVFLDLGCGTGVPLLEIAQRCHQSRAWGLDPWAAAGDRARFKAKKMGLPHVAVKQGQAEKMPFPAGFFDLVVSNNGLNNVADPALALRECARVLKPGGQLVFTANLPETMHEFYDALRHALKELGQAELLPRVEEHIAARRKPLADWKRLVSAAGLSVDGVAHGRFHQFYSSAAALYGHFFIRQAFLPAWREMLPAPLVDRILGAAGKRLDEVAKVHHGVRLTIPMACLSARKPAKESA